MKATHKDEAIRALRQVVTRLGSSEPLEGLERFQVKATAEFALGEVSAIDELKRVRRVPEAAGSADGARG